MKRGTRDLKLEGGDEGTEAEIKGRTELKKAGGLKELEKARDRSPPEPTEGSRSPTTSLILNHEIHFRCLTFKAVR